MDFIVNTNGQLNQTSISVMDYGFLYGFGLFETMRAYESHIFYLDRHLARLYRSADMLQWSFPWKKDELAGQVLKTLASLDGHDAYVRLSVTRGIGTGLDPATCIEPSFTIIVRPFHPLAESKYQQGWHLITSTICRNSTSPLSRVKSLNYADNILAKQEAKNKGADEGLLLNETGCIAECCTANIFMVKNSVLLTPCLSCGILDGITRQIVLEIAQKMNIPFAQQQLAPAELADAEEIFCTNSLLEIMPVTQWEAQKINQGTPGPITALIREQYRRMVKGFINKQQNEK